MSTADRGGTSRATRLPAPTAREAAPPAATPWHGGGRSGSQHGATRGAGAPPETTPPETTPAETTPPAAAPAGAGLDWQQQRRHRSDALWYFCGEHPAGFSTTATLRASGYTDPGRVEWFVRQGADKVYAPGGYRGTEITLHSSAGSRRADDVHVEVQETLPDGSVTSHLGRLTVRKPHRLILRGTTDHSTCPPWERSHGTCASLWSEVAYRIVDNVGGTIVGATVNERFPGPVVHDQPNRWTAATMTAGTAWPHTDGTFVDNLYKCCGIPTPVGSASPQYGDPVYHEPQEFYVGSTVPGRGCRVQRHTLQFFRGYADHEHIRSPAP